MPLPYEHVVVIGASAGGVTALLEISERLPASFPAPVCVVQHVGSNPSILPELLRYRGANAAMHAEDGQQLQAGTLLIAPPDRHMLLEGDRVRLTHGPKENHARPAIDPLFRTAAVSLGPRVIGVVLTGQMDDGTAGLAAVKDCGGTAIVQDPATAEEPSMPRSALDNVPVDHCVALAEIAPLLTRLVGVPASAGDPAPPERLVREAAINRGEATMENLARIGSPVPLTCPDCGGGMWEIQSGAPLRYRCHTGHAYSALSLGHAQQEVSERAIWSGARALREREMLLRRLAAVAASLGDAAQAAAAQSEADRLRARVASLAHLAQSAPPNEPDNAA